MSLRVRLESVGLDQCGVSVISIAELYYGAACSPEEQISRREREAAAVSEQFAIVPLAEAVSIYAVEKARLRRAGQLIQDNDLFIGATARAHDLILVTGNTGHFARMQGITLEDWTAPADNAFLTP